MKMFDTIAAFATPLGSGGVAIIRVSGADSEKVSQNVVKTKSGKKLTELESHKLTLSDIHKAGDESASVDQALVSVMRAPHSYTGETVVEINCHGGYFAAGLILNELLSCGARLAEAGEFTRRAFINGKTDMTGAEAAMDIIDSTSGLGLGNAANVLNGALAEKINDIRQDIMEITSHISAAVDYPDEVDPLTDEEVLEKLNLISSKISELIDSFETGKILRDGIHTVIVGKPNVGKSSLLNALSRSDRAIVTDIPGTTRDTIEEYINIKGASLRLLDTAGIRAEVSDEVEQIGIDRAMENIKIADLCLFVIDSNSKLEPEDEKIAKALKGKTTIVILNKTDKSAEITPIELKNRFGFETDDIVETSTPKDKTPAGIEKLEERITEKFALGTIKSGEVYVSNTRQRDSLVKARESVDLALNGVGMPFDLLYVDLEDTLSALGEITGATVQEEIIDQVFSRFCVGK